MQAASPTLEPLVTLGRAKVSRQNLAEMVATDDAGHWVPPGVMPSSYLEEIVGILGVHLATEPIRDGCLGLYCPKGPFGKGGIQLSPLLETPGDLGCHPDTRPERLRCSVLAHEIGHHRLHRHGLLHWPKTGRAQRMRRDRMEPQAYWYAACLLLPRPLLESDRNLFLLYIAQEYEGTVSEFVLWSRLQLIANRFGVTRSLVVSRLVKLGFLERRGRQVTMARGPAHP